MQDPNEGKHHGDVGGITQDPFAALAVDIKRKELHDRLEDLQLQVITIDDWMLIQRATFDIDVRGEPYHSVQIYVNLERMTYIRRVWGVSESKGELESMKDVEDLCIATFNKSIVCSGYIDFDHGKDNLVQVRRARFFVRTCVRPMPPLRWCLVCAMSE